MTALSSETVARRVLRDTFGSRPATELQELHGGRSGAKTFSVLVEGERFVVRIPDRAREQHATRSDREIACMSFAAQHGLGPALRHVDRVTGTTVSAKIEDVLVGPARARAFGRLERLAAVLRKLHDGPPLPAEGHLSELVDHFEEAFRRRASLDALADVFRATRRASAAMARSGRRTPCHNDLNPGNVLETADRVWLIDWEIAGWGDPFVDVAQVGVFGLHAPEMRSALLRAYLGHSPDPVERAHAALARVMALGVYAMSFTMVAQLSGLIPLGDGPRPLAAVMPAFTQGDANAADVAATLRDATLREAASTEVVGALERRA